MTRAEVLRDLVTAGRGFGSQRLYDVAAEFDLLASDVFVIAGSAVPAHLLPPARDPDVMREFTYRVTYCDHAQLATLTDFVQSLASVSPTSGREMPHIPGARPSGTDRFAEILDGFMRNRGLGLYEMPFTGLSTVTIKGMLDGRWHTLQQLKAMAGPLGWTVEDLAVIADEPLTSFDDCSALCRHVGRVYVAAIPLSTARLSEAAIEADRLTRRTRHGAWRPVAPRANDCPDSGSRSGDA